MKHHSSRLGRKEGIAGLLLVTPQIIYFLVFFLLPAYYFFSSFSQVLIMDAIISGLSSAKERT